MAEFQKVMSELRRLCAKRDCGNCPIGEGAKNDKAFCSVWVTNHPEEAERIIMQWSLEHPIKTNRDKFKEVFGLDYLDSLPGGCSAWLTAEYKGGQDNGTD